MQRRQYLAGVAAAGAIAVAGCSGGGGGGPETLIEDYISAIDNGDFEALENLIHQDSPQRPLQEGSGDQADQIDYSVSNISEVDEEIEYSAGEYDNVDEFRLMEADISASGTIFGQEIDQTQTARIIVAQNTDGDWKIWQGQGAQGQDSGGSQSEETEQTQTEDGGQ